MKGYVFYRADGTLAGFGTCGADELAHQVMPACALLEVTLAQVSAVRSAPSAWHVVSGALVPV